MKFSLGMLNSARRILSDFNNATTTILRVVVLPIKADSVTQWVLFSIVKDLGPYNAIMGLAWMHSMKVIPSTYHQTVSYLTNVRQVDLLCSQWAVDQIREEVRDPLAVDPLEKVMLDGQVKFTYVNSLMSGDEK